MTHEFIDPQQITFDPATLDDSELLFRCRNDPETRKHSIQQAEVERGEHQRWLSGSLASSTRQLYVALYDGHPAGTVRFDQAAERPTDSEISWCVAPEARGKGFGKWMVKRATALRSETLLARIRRENEASQKIAQFAGFKMQSDEEGITVWRLDR